MNNPVSEVAALLVRRLSEETLDYLPLVLSKPDGTVDHQAASPDLESLAETVAACSACDLAKFRTRTVFGEGPAGSRLMFVGEAPGAEEDATGRPFVGPAGRLLDKMIGAMGLSRRDCYIANAVKCRPPGNVTPSAHQAAVCFPFLERQIGLVGPEFIVALGRVAAHALTGGDSPIARLRGRWHRWGDIPFVVTYHPAALLRDPSRKRLAWADLKMVMARMGLPVG